MRNSRKGFQVVILIGRRTMAAGSTVVPAGTVYCSSMHSVYPTPPTPHSGGTERDWEGVPRRYFAPGSKSWRCACVHGDDLNSGRVKLYPSCQPTDGECKIYPDQIAKLKESGG